MKKSMLILLLAVSVFAAGCGKTEKEVPRTEPEATEILEITEAGHAEIPATEAASPEFDLESVREQADAIMNALETDGSLSQAEMNVMAGERFDLWDNALNQLWEELKRTLPEAEFEKLLNEQRQWISEKEAAVEEAGKEFAGGSLYQLITNNEAARITQKRVYELYELLVQP